MKLSKLENFESNAEQIIECDLFILCNCLEARATNISEKLEIHPQKAIVINTPESNAFNKTVLRTENIVFSEIYESISKKIIKEITTSEENSKIVIDISCMSRPIMAEIFSTIAFLIPTKSVELVTLYSLAEFTPPPSESLANESIEPVHELLAGWSTPETKPTSLILGLGYEPDKAEGASEYFEPSDQWIFIPESPVLEFLDQVNTNNNNLISKTEETRKINYNVSDPELTYGQLELVISTLIKKSNPVLLPFGPKVFFFLCLLQCLNHPELGVWRVTGRGITNSPNVNASKHIIGFTCLLVQDV